MYDKENRKVDWNYITELHRLQGESMHFANKLKTEHTFFQKQKMKVNLATQLLSDSVTNAIEFCNLKLDLCTFKHSEATVQLLRVFNRLFDVINSRNFTRYEYKVPINPNNEINILEFLNEAFLYIQNLKTSNGEKMLESTCKTGFIGFLISIQSLRILYNNLVKNCTPLLKYLPMYKISQDHIELFFFCYKIPRWVE